MNDALEKRLSIVYQLLLAAGGVGWLALPPPWKHVAGVLLGVGLVLAAVVVTHNVREWLAAKKKLEEAKAKVDAIERRE